MSDLEPLISAIVNSSKLLKLKEFMEYVDNINWEMSDTSLDGSTLIRVSPDGENGMVYPTLFSCENPSRAMCSELGRDFIRRNEIRNRHWQFKYDTAPRRCVDTVQSLISSGGFKTYRELVASIHDPLCRLVAINVSNALIANKVAARDSLGITITKYPATEQYCNGLRYHSLVPLWSVYCPDSIQYDYGLALTYAMDFTTLKSLVSCSTLKEPVQALVVRLAQ
jgi:hypothetical protein